MIYEIIGKIIITFLLLIALFLAIFFAPELLKIGYNKTSNWIQIIIDIIFVIILIGGLGTLIYLSL